MDASLSDLGGKEFQELTHGLRALLAITGVKSATIQSWAYLSEQLERRRGHRMNKVSALSLAVALATSVAAVVTTAEAQAQTLTTLHSFDGTDGSGPTYALTQATNGALYGTASAGGAALAGTVFKITTTGKFELLFSFDNTDGNTPDSALTQGTNGDLYGSTVFGGTNCSGSGCGTLFKITPAGKFSTWFSFDGTNGSRPEGGVTQATNGDLYGTTVLGGVGNVGTVLKITRGGMLTTLDSFNDGGVIYCPSGCRPNGQLIQAAKGDFYGTTFAGGTYGDGTVFRVTPGGTLTTLSSFADGSDGAAPSGALIQSADGNFYGTTQGGGPGLGGTIFMMSAAGTRTTLYSFCSDGTYPNCPDGYYPNAGLIQATDGNFYGTTVYGGANGYGTVFRISPDGSLSTLYSFCSQSDCTDGGFPYAALLQDTDGDFYGATLEGGLGYVGGDTGNGTIFRLSAGLGPFVMTQTTSGKVGSSVNILGSNLTGSTSVTFNGTSATFIVNSTGTVITATVPPGATTGAVQVVTPSGTLDSSVVYTVKP